jgi:hypothetical protein
VQHLPGGGVPRLTTLVLQGSIHRSAGVHDGVARWCPYEIIHGLVNTSPLVSCKHTKTQNGAAQLVNCKIMCLWCSASPSLQCVKTGCACPWHRSHTQHSGVCCYCALHVTVPIITVTAKSPKAIKSVAQLARTLSHCLSVHMPLHSYNDNLFSGRKFAFIFGFVCDFRLQMACV